MSQGLGEVDGETRMDVPTMMNVLMAVYNNVRDDEVMDEVAEAVSDAICMLGDMRKVAQQIATEDRPMLRDTGLDVALFGTSPNPRKLC